MNEENICSHGCGKLAIKKFKTGGWCCSENANSCEGKRQRDSEKKKGIDPFKKAGVPHPRGATGLAPWNKGKTYEDILGYEKSSEYKKKISKGRTLLERSADWDRISEDKKESIRKRCAVLGARTGGYKKGSGRGKSGWYKGVWCDSSWELAFLIYHLDQNIPIRRFEGYFEYSWEGKVHKYYPDFQVGENIYELKGIPSERELEKIKQAPKKIIMITEDNMKPYLNYVKEKYGVKFISLYESKSGNNKE
jgi:hypothetical protein